MFRESYFGAESIAVGGGRPHKDDDLHCIIVYPYSAPLLSFSDCDTYTLLSILSKSSVPELVLDKSRNL